MFPSVGFAASEGLVFPSPHVDIQPKLDARRSVVPRRVNLDPPKIPITTGNPRRFPGVVAPTTAAIPLVIATALRVDITQGGRDLVIHPRIKGTGLQLVIGHREFQPPIVKVRRLSVDGNEYENLPKPRLAKVSSIRLVKWQFPRSDLVDRTEVLPLVQVLPRPDVPVSKPKFERHGHMSVLRGRDAHKE